MKEEYIKTLENGKSVRLIIAKLGEKDYEIVKFDFEYFSPKVEKIAEDLLKELTDDADNEGITLHVNFKERLDR